MQKIVFYGLNQLVFPFNKDENSKIKQKKNLEVPIKKELAIVVIILV